MSHYVGGEEGRKEKVGEKEVFRYVTRLGTRLLTLGLIHGTVSLLSRI